jgi:hypothetical protein
MASIRFFLPSLTPACFGGAGSAAVFDAGDFGFAAAADFF